MRNQIFYVLLIMTMITVTSCGGSGGTSTYDSDASTSTVSKLFVTKLTSGGVDIGAVFADNSGNTIVSIMDEDYPDEVKTLIVNTSDSSYATATMDDGLPSSVTDGTTTATFSNWIGSTVDVTITGDGDSETISDVDFSDYADSTDASKDWPEFFGAAWTTLSVAMCPVSLALAGASIGAGMPAAVVSCSLAGTNLYRLLSGQPTLVEAAARYVSSPSACETVYENGGSMAELQTCAASAGFTARQNATYINENGETENDTDVDGDEGGVAGDDSSGSFAGSCTISSNGFCMNYSNGQSVSSAQDSCSNSGGVYSSAACSTGNAIGRCDIGDLDNGFSMVFYESLFTEQYAIDYCKVMGGTYVSL